MKLSKFKLPNRLEHTLNQDEYYFLGFITDEGFLTFGNRYNLYSRAGSVECIDDLKDKLRHLISTGQSMMFPHRISLHKDILHLKGRCPFNQTLLILTYNKSTQVVSLVYKADTLEDYDQWIVDNYISR